MCRFHKKRLETSRRESGRSGYTVTELLVVIGIIVFLLGMLLPILSNARHHAVEVTCASNLRQIGVAINLYTSQTGYYPGCQHFAGFGDPRTFAIWPTRLRSIIGPQTPEGAMKLFRCPDNAQADDWNLKLGSGTGFAQESDTGFGYQLGERLLQVDTIAFSYAYNDWGAGANGAPGDKQTGLGGDIDYPLQSNGYGAELKATRVVNPAEMIAVTDSSSAGSFNYNIDPREVPQYPGKVHRNGSNVLYCDDHVEWHSQKELINVDPATPDGTAMNRQWNNDNQVHLRIE